MIGYDSAKDEILVYVRAFYGQAKWDLSLHQTNLSSLKVDLAQAEYYSYIAYAMLDGQMFPKLKPLLKKYLVSSPKEVLEKGNMT